MFSSTYFLLIEARPGYMRLGTRSVNSKGLAKTRCIQPRLGRVAAPFCVLHVDMNELGVCMLHVVVSSELGWLLLRIDIKDSQI